MDGSNSQQAVAAAWIVRNGLLFYPCDLDMICSCTKASCGMNIVHTLLMLGLSHNDCKLDEIRATLISC